MAVDNVSQKLIRELESDLSEFLIEEMSPPNPQNRNESEMYKYKGLMLLSMDPKVKRFEKTFLVRIGTLEAEFSLSTGEKIHGGIGPIEDKLVLKWFKIGEHAEVLQAVYRKIQKANEEDNEIKTFGLDDDDDL